MAERIDALQDLTLYTVTELEPVLGVSAQTIKRYIKSGKLPAKKIGGKWKVTRADLEKFISGDTAE